jgi:hypothetical protein
MREISPAVNLSADEYFAVIPSPETRQFVMAVRRQKLAGTRPRLSTTLIDHSVLLTKNIRTILLDHIAALVDENIYGRCEMCRQFADLLQRSLVLLGLPARAVLGTGIYFSEGHEVFRWDHSWVRIGREVIDGNADSMSENPLVPSSLRVVPYWGPIEKTPKDRRLVQNKALDLPRNDTDVCDIWWLELKQWISQGLNPV